MSLSKKRSSNLASSILSTLPPIAPTIGSAPQQSEQLQPETQQINEITKKKIPQTIKLGSRLIFTSRRPQSWSWKPFSSSARRDEAQFSHWVRSNAEYPDYPYARFDVSLDKLTIGDDDWALLSEEWGEINKDAKSGSASTASTAGGSGSVKANKSMAEKLIIKTESKIPLWTREETETLLALAHQYELRWPVIIDRWHERFNMLPDGSLNTLSAVRSVEDLQYRYYQVGNVLARKQLEGVAGKVNDNNAGSANVVAAGANATIPGKGDVKQSSSQLEPSDQQALATLSKNLAAHPTLVPNVSLPNTGTTLHNKPFDLLAEKARRAQLRHLWNRPKAEEKEEEELRAELRAIELALRKMKKSGKFLVPKGSAHSVSAAEARGDAKTAAERKAELDAYVSTTNNLTASFLATAPVPTPGTPYLQSGRLFPPALGGGLNKSTLKQMEDILAELKVKEPIATKRACDLYDEVRKDALTLLILQKIVLRKEAEVIAKRGKLVNAMGAGNGDVVIEEKPESKKRKKSDADKHAAVADPNQPAASSTGASTKKATKSAGNQDSVGKKLPTTTGQPKKKAKKSAAPALPLTGASASATTAAVVAPTGAINPLNIGNSASGAAGAAPPTLSSAPKAPPTAATNLSATKTAKKRGRPAKTPSAPASST
jgi:DNA methyltransferase 1-associated protein 1